MSVCQQELCPNWSGDGAVCPCALFDLAPSPLICGDCQDDRCDRCTFDPCECPHV